MPLVTVFTAFNSAEAQLVRSRLEAAGLRVFVMDELSALSIEGYALAAGGIKVQVPDEDAKEALELVHNGGRGNAAEEQD
ncbi:MAG: DUF2007 domain-containing protein [Verrucomicrobia bacterium]|nr:DUF2007 domain-containing protein [Verrucomicrobiota bacterium]MBM3870835.1 DUF2007 domain-containing protein [Verrucomicrobiota bacterium]